MVLSSTFSRFALSTKLHSSITTTPYARPKGLRCAESPVLDYPTERARPATLAEGPSDDEVQDVKGQDFIVLIAQVLPHLLSERLAAGAAPGAMIRTCGLAPRGLNATNEVVVSCPAKP